MPPVEKPLLDAIKAGGLRHPPGMREDVEAVVAAAVPDSTTLLAAIDRLAEGLEAFVEPERA